MQEGIPRFKTIVTDFSKDSIKDIIHGKPVFAYELVDKDTDKVNTLVGVRFWVEMYDVEKIAKFLTWIARNMDIAVTPFTELGSGCTTPFSYAINKICNGVFNEQCLEELHNNGYTDLCVKQIHAVGHGIFMWVRIHVELHGYTQISRTYTLTGRIFIVTDTYGKFNQVQKELLKYVDRPPELVRPM